MKKLILGLVLGLNILIAQQIGDYDLDCESLQSSNYNVYVNGFAYPVNVSVSLTGRIKQGRNEIVVIANEDITNVHLEFTDGNKGGKTISNWNIKLTNGVARKLYIDNLNNYSFNNVWETADSLTTLSSSDIASISNTVNKIIDILENEKFGVDFGRFSSNESKYGTMMSMAWQGSTFEEVVESGRYIFTNGYTGADRTSFTKNVDYEIRISPYNNKIINVRSKRGLPLVYIGTADSDDFMNFDLKYFYFRFFKKDGKWWRY